MSQIANTTDTRWILSACSAEVAEMGDVEIRCFPFRIGRFNQLELTLPRRTVSGHHAEITVEGSRVFIRDNDSRNGTFVNGSRITEKTCIRRGDLIQIAQAVFRVENNDAEEVFSQTLAPGLIENAYAIVEFDRLMNERLVTPHYQSIVDINNGEVYGYEALARGIPEEMRSPKAMFDAAERLQQENALSRMLREVAVEEAKTLPASQPLFLNSHQHEIHDDTTMIRSMAEIRHMYPEQSIVLEIHESTVTDLEQMQVISAEMKKLDIEIAYDDFGAGQARFFELIEEPPNYLKFDIRLMKDIHLASPRRRKTIEGLVRMVDELGIVCLAEGIESKEEADVCREIGFTLAQGFYFSRPVPFADLGIKS